MGEVMTADDLETLLVLGEALACDCDNTDGWEDGAPTIRNLIAALREMLMRAGAFRPSDRDNWLPPNGEWSPVFRDEKRIAEKAARNLLTTTTISEGPQA